MPGRVAVLHSGLRPGELEEYRRRIRDREVDVVVGSRSALFAPTADPALIIVDEEHEWTYKQIEPAPRYQVREVVERYCELTGAVALFGSATPDLVTYARARAGRYALLDLPQRVRSPAAGESIPPAIPLPTVEVVDLREELVAGNRSIFSGALRTALDAALAGGQQAMLFLNRRGAGIVVCRTCGEAVGCDRCDIPLTLHQYPAPPDGSRPPGSALHCHECGFRAAPPAAARTAAASACARWAWAPSASRPRSRRRSRAPARCAGTATPCAAATATAACSNASATARPTCSSARR